MSIVLYKNPHAVDLVHNKLFFQIKGIPANLNPGEKAKLVIDTRSDSIDPDDPPLWYPENNSSMELTCLGQTHRFIFLDAFPVMVPPDGYDYVLPTNSNRDVATALSNYPPFRDNYSIYFTGILMNIQALIDGAGYNIIADKLPEPYSEHENVSGVDPVSPTNYHFLVQVFANNLSDPGTFVPLPEFRIDPNNDQLSHLEVGQILRSRFRNYFELPDFSLSKPVKALIPTISYYLSFKEMSGVNLLSTLTTLTYKVINGRVNHADHPRFNLRTWINTDKKFLSNMPSQVYTWHGAKHFLYYLSPFSNVTQVRVKLDINSTQVTDPDEHFSEVISLNQDEILIIPVTHMLDSIATPEKLVSVSVSLIDSSDITLANAITFLFLPKTLFNRAFLFQNRLGGFDTIITYKQSNSLKVKKDEKRQILTPDYSPYIGDLSSDEPDIEDTFTAETAPVSSAMAQHYKELAASKVAFLQGDDRWIRVWIEAGSFKTVDEKKDLHVFKFKYKPMFDGDMLSTELKLPEPPHEDYSQEYLKTDYQ